jgi:cell division topological specificity factor
MNLLSLFKKRNTAPVARERLQLLLAHERAVIGQTNLISILKEEILGVIAKHFPLDPNCVKVKMERGDTISILEVDVEIPTTTPTPARVALSA